ncbi:unnamed protein product [Lampetra fluviatilis]
MDLLLLLLLLLLVPQEARGYSSGLVVAACGDLVPGHPGRPQAGPSNVSVEAAPALDPRRGLGSPPLGSFSLTGAAAEGQLLDCGGRANSAVSHRNGAEKRRVQFTWIAPNPSPDYVMFRATLVRDVATYWVGQRGAVVARAGVPTLAPDAAWPTDSAAPFLDVGPLTQPVSDVGLWA